MALPDRGRSDILLNSLLLRDSGRWLPDNPGDGSLYTPAPSDRNAKLFLIGGSLCNWPLHAAQAAGIRFAGEFQ